MLDPGFSAILARAAADLVGWPRRLGERYAEESNRVSEYAASALGRRVDSDGLIRPLDLMDDAARGDRRTSALALRAGPRAPSGRRRQVT